MPTRLRVTRSLENFKHRISFVQIVRSIRQGEFMGDLGWSPK